MPEQDIVQLLNSRDRRGAGELLTHYGALMRYIISPILPNAQDAEECLSEVFMRVWDKIEQYDPERGSFKAWLTALTRNTALNYARKIKNSGNEEELYSELPSPEPTPEELFVQQERSKALAQALRLLSDKERILFYRKYYYMQSTAQIASESGLTERAVEGRLYRLKKTLREALGGGELE